MAARVGADKWMFFTTSLLILAGLAMVFSASAVVAQERYHSEFAFVGRQGGWALAGVVALLALMQVDYTRYNSPRFIYAALCVTTVLLVLVFFFPGSHNTSWNTTRLINQKQTKLRVMTSKTQSILM